MAAIMKKIGILTFHSAMNYGAVLQTFALYRTVQKLGYNPIVINRQATTIFSGTIRSIIRYLLISILPIELCACNKKLYVAKRFYLFLQKYLPKKTIPYFTNTQLHHARFDIQCIITGSDQIWNYNLSERQSPGMGLNMFVDFLPDQIKRIAYAASFGNNSWCYDKVITSKVYCLMDKYTAISVRERSGVNICRDVFGKSAEAVLDPTLLLESTEYDKLIQDEPNIDSESYILIFKFNWDTEFCKLITSIAHNSKISVCSINSKVKDNSYKTVYFPTVGQWLAYIKNAKMVITDSFHALAFSIIFNRPFVVLNNGFEERMDRQLDLIKALGFENRYLKCDEVMDKLSSLMDIEYDNAKNVLLDRKTKSINFLKRNLK